ncbi:MAG TPA: 16S rRNA (guanine(966)-N(2))-methyltransferase RsmD [Chloroflexota bacterium]
MPVRIIAGEARGRVIKTPPGATTRPTADRVRGAIFSMLEAEAYKRGRWGGESDAYPYRTVLDLYAGSGALGIEALSRGARWADFVERNPRACATVRENLRELRFADRARVYCMDVEAAIATLERERRKYDVILADPPYNDPAVPAVLARVGRSPLVHDGTMLMLEHARGQTPPPRLGRFALERTRHHGTTAISLYVVAYGAEET